MRRAAFAAFAVTLVAMLGVKSTSSEEPAELVVADVGGDHQFKQFGHDVLRRQYVALQQRKAWEMSAAELQKAIDEMEDELGPPVEPELLPVLEQLQEIARTRINHPTLWHKAMLAEELLRTHDAETLNAVSDALRKGRVPRDGGRD